MPILFAEFEGMRLPVYLEAPRGRAALALRTQFRRCSKKNCKACPHGPYAYAVVPHAKGTRLKYLGALHASSSEFAPTRKETKIHRAAARARRRR